MRVFSYTQELGSLFKVWVWWAKACSTSYPKSSPGQYWAPTCIKQLLQERGCSAVCLSWLSRAKEG